MLNNEAYEPTTKQCVKVQSRIPLVMYCINWHEVNKLKDKWRKQYSQPFLKVFPSFGSLTNTVEMEKLQPKEDSITEPRIWSKSGKEHDYHIEKRRNLGTKDEIEKVGIVLDSRNEDGSSEDEFWHTPRSQHIQRSDVPFLTTCILTRKILEENAHCSQTELYRIVKLNIRHNDLTSLGVGILGRWCPMLKFFTIDVNKLSTLKGAFHGCEESLEYVLVKENLLNDLKGLESLQNLKVLSLEGNFISYIGPSIKVHKDPNVFDNRVKTGPKTTTMMTTSSGSNGFCASMLSLTPRTLCQSSQGISRFLEDKNDPWVCLTSQNIPIQHAPDIIWPKLKKMCLKNNCISQIWELGSMCPNLEELDLGSNELVTLGGCDGGALIGLKNLRLLDVGQNKIKGRSLWKDLSHCPLLVSLVASRNQLTELPTHLGSVMLREIWLNGNFIRCLACKAWLPNLQRFYLQDNLIDNLESLWGCPSLEVTNSSYSIQFMHFSLLLIYIFYYNLFF